MNNLACGKSISFAGIGQPGMQSRERVVRPIYSISPCALLPPELLRGARLNVRFVLDG